MPPRRSSGRVKAAAAAPAPPASSSSSGAKPTRTAVTASATAPASSSRSLRPRRSSGNYTISSDEDDEEKSSGSEHREDDDDDDDAHTPDSQESREVPADEDEEQEEPVDRPERGTEAGRSLRPRGSLAAPEGLKDYVDTNSALANRKRKKRTFTVPKRRVSGRLPPGRACQACRESRRRCDRERPRCSGCVKSNKVCVVPDGSRTGPDGEVQDDWQPEPEDEKDVTIRTEIRKSLEATRAKRDIFFKKYGDLFDSLLTGRSYITKLHERSEKAAEDKARVLVEEKLKVEHEAVEKAKTEADGDVAMNGTPEAAKLEATKMDAAKLDAAKLDTAKLDTGKLEAANSDAAKLEANGTTLPIIAPNGGEVPETNGVKNEEGIVGEKKPEDFNRDTKSGEGEKADGAVGESDDVVPYKLLDHQPEGVKATMKPYQLSGLSFLVWLYNNGANGILGDEMGLGKTLQTLSLFSYLTTYEPAPEGQQRPFLVVCPLSVLSSWISECKRWTPHLRVLRFHGPATERTRLKRIAETGEGVGNDEQEDGRGYDVVVTSYEVFDREKNWFRRAFVWRYVVLDEGHKIKNEKTNVAQALQGLSAEYRLILTGTPLQNNLTELWALLHWLFPEVFTENTSKLFSDAFDLTLGKNDLQVMDDARKLLELVMLRRMKESQGVNLGLPQKTEVVMFLPLTPMQRFWYKRLLTRLDKGLLEGVFKSAKDKVEQEEEEDVNDHTEHHIVKDKELEELSDDQWGETRAIVEQAVEESKTDQKWRKLMNLLMQLRKCCDHPYLLPNAEPPEVDHERDQSHVVLASSKLIFLDKLIDELCIKQNKKVLIFSGFTRMLDVCEDLMHYKGGDGAKFRYGRLDGTTPRARRNLGIKLFNSDPEYKVMLISTRAGGLGINLASASNVVMLESDWNPQADLQAQARAHRIGQTQPVTIYRLITQGTVEEQMMGRIRKKLYLSAKVTESMRDIHTSTSSTGVSGETEENMPTLSTGQLMSLVRSGSRAIARPEIDPAEMLKWTWEETVNKCRDYQEKLELLDKDNEAAALQNEEERRWLSEMERVETRVFEGKKHEKSSGPESNSVIAAEWSREARRIGMERVTMIDGHPVLKETIGNNEWEAVKTFAGKNIPGLAEPAKRKRKQIEHQDYCQVCFDGGVLHTCSGCPRTYHVHCLPDDFKPKLKAKGGHFYCPQHQCIDCEQKTTNAGGMLYRCRWCESAYCEDCLDWEHTELLGETLMELELLDFGAIEQAFWIKCVNCIELHKTDPEAVKLCESLQAEWEEKRKEKERQERREAKEKAIAEVEAAAAVAAAPELSMDVTTAEGSEVNTPTGDSVNGAHTPIGASTGKRKRAATNTANYATPPSGRGRKKRVNLQTPRGTPTGRGAGTLTGEIPPAMAQAQAQAHANSQAMGIGQQALAPGGGLGSGLVPLAPKGAVGAIPGTSTLQQQPPPQRQQGPPPGMVRKVPVLELD